MSMNAVQIYAVLAIGLLAAVGQAQMQMQHTQPLVAPAAAPNAFAPGNGMAMAPATANQVNNDGSGCPSNQSSLLFVQQSMKADFLTANGKTILTMSNVGPTVFFTDKPERHAGAMSTGYFTTDKSFFSNTSNQWLDSPNAALYGMNGVGDRPLGDTVAIITLSNPVFDNSTNDLKYDVTFVPNVHHASPTADFYKKHANATGSPKVIDRIQAALRLKNAALFIDNFQSTGLLAGNPVDNTYIPGGANGYPGAGYPGVAGGWW